MTSAEVENAIRVVREKALSQSSTPAERAGLVLAEEALRALFQIRDELRSIRIDLENRTSRELGR